MTEALQVRPEPSVLAAYTKQQLDLITNTVAKGATAEELKLFLYTAQKRGFDPLAKQIYFRKTVSNKGDVQLAFITSIDSYRLTAARTGQYVGSDEPIFGYEQDDRGINLVVSAKVTVWRLVQGQRCPFTATVYWDEFFPGEKQGFMWVKMPRHMLAKVAEAHALRKAFPEELAGVHIEEEMEKHMPVHNPDVAVEIVKEQFAEGQKKADERTLKELKADFHRLWDLCIELGAPIEEIIKRAGYPKGTKIGAVTDAEAIVVWNEGLRSYRDELESKQS